MPLLWPFNSAPIYHSLVNQGEVTSQNDHHLPRKLDTSQEPSPKASLWGNEKHRSRFLYLNAALACLLTLLLVSSVWFIARHHGLMKPQCDVLPPEGYLPNDYEQHQGGAWPSVRTTSTQSALLQSKAWNYTHPPASPCGHSPSAARAAGCKWSAMTFAWYPAACYDQQLENDFLDLDDWTWHWDQTLSAGTQLPRDEVLRGDERHAFVSARFHAEHCRMSTRKLLRGILGADGVLLDNYVSRMGHLHHCEEFTDKASQMQILYAEGGAKYLSCIAP